MPCGERLEETLLTLSELVRSTFFASCKYFLTEMQCFSQFILNKIQWLESEAGWDKTERH